MDSLVYFLFKERTSFLFVGTLAMLLLGKPTVASFIAGVPFVIAGEAIRLWVSGCLNKLDSLATAGPFALCRNPMYIGTFLISTGYFIMANRLDVLIVGTILFWLFHAGAVLYEEKLLREKFGTEYKRYCERVPRFIPRFRRFAGKGQFSLEQLVVNREHKRIILAVIIIALLFLKIHYPGFSFINWGVALRP
mgnify:CR=1 FL=1